jgi:hypothetical protein
LVADAKPGDSLFCHYSGKFHRATVLYLSYFSIASVLTCCLFLYIYIYIYVYRSRRKDAR